MARQPLGGLGRLIFRGFTITLFRHTTVGRISSSQRRLPDNTQHSQETDIHALGGIRTHNPSKRADVDPRLRLRDHWDRLITVYGMIITIYDKGRRRIAWRYYTRFCPGWLRNASVKGLQTDKSGHLSSTTRSPLLALSIGRITARRGTYHLSSCSWWGSAWESVVQDTLATRLSAEPPATLCSHYLATPAQPSHTPRSRETLHWHW
jgi:hypothetical protein